MALRFLIQRLSATRLPRKGFPVWSVSLSLQTPDARIACLLTTKRLQGLTDAFDEMERTRISLNAAWPADAVPTIYAHPNISEADYQELCAEAGRRAWLVLRNDKEKQS